MPSFCREIKICNNQSWLWWKVKITLEWADCITEKTLSLCPDSMLGSWTTSASVRKQFRLIAEQIDHLKRWQVSDCHLKITSYRRMQVYKGQVWGGQSKNRAGSMLDELMHTWWWWQHARLKTDHKRLTTNTNKLQINWKSLWFCVHSIAKWWHLNKS